MADSPKPHTVPRKPAGEAPAKKPVEARPTSKLDKNELLGLVGNMRKPAAPTVVPYDADAEVEIEKSEDAAPMPIRRVAAVEKRIVRTVARRTPIAGIAPLQKVEPASTPTPATPKPPASDEYFDLFAEGSDNAIDVGAPAATAPVTDEPPPPVTAAVIPPVVESQPESRAEIAAAPARVEPPPPVELAERSAEAQPPVADAVAPSSGMPSKRTLQLAGIGVLVVLLGLLIAVLR